MNKSISTKTFLTSSFLLLILGLVFLGGLYFFLNQNFKDSIASRYYPVTKKSVSLHLEINNPDDELVVFDKNILVSGKTSPNSILIISTPTSDTSLEAKKNGEFSQIIPLASGLNEINITAFDNSGNTQSQIRTVFYSEEKL